MIKFHAILLALILTSVGTDLFDFIVKNYDRQINSKKPKRKEQKSGEKGRKIKHLIFKIKSVKFVVWYLFKFIQK